MKAKFELANIEGIDPYDEYDQIKYNPICYYIPIGDGLYRPTMDRRVFCGEACKLIAAYGDHNIAAQLETLIAAEFQIYDLCLATKTSLKELNSIRTWSDANIPPYIRKAWDWCFGIHCEWHPINQQKVHAEQIEIQTIFKENTAALHKYRNITRPARKEKVSKKSVELAIGLVVPYQEDFDPDAYVQTNIKTLKSIPLVIDMQTKTMGKRTHFLVKSQLKDLLNKQYPDIVFNKHEDLLSWLQNNGIPPSSFFRAFNLPSIGHDALGFSKTWEIVNTFIGRKLISIKNKKRKACVKPRKKIEIHYNKEQFVAACKKEKEEAIFAYATVKDLLPILKSMGFSVNAFLKDLGISQNALKGNRSHSRILLKVNEYLGFEFFSNIGKETVPKQVPLVCSSTPKLKKKLFPSN